MAACTSHRAFPSPQHDHRSCFAATLARAEQAFVARAMRLTPLRRRVLEEIAGSHDAVGAYDLLERLAQKGDRLAPISVYRALDALQSADVVHRLESRNAYFACHGRHEASQRRLYLVCHDCRAVAEVEAEPIFLGIDAAAEAAGFRGHSAMVEVAGCCADCRAKADGRGPD